MKHIVSYSGGLGSFMAAYLTIQEYGTSDVVLIFTDTRTEDEDLYRFLNESAEYLQLPVEVISDGRDIWEVFEDVSYMGNSRVDPCSRILKREPARKWMKEHYSEKEAILYLGIGWDEMHRMDAISKNWQPYSVKAPLVDTPIHRDAIFDVLRQANIKPPKLYALGFLHNNCGGFCIKTGQAQFLRLLKTMPDRYAIHEDRQEKLFRKIGQHGFISVTRQGKTDYLSLKDFRCFVKDGATIDMFDIGGCGCFA